MASPLAGRPPFATDEPATIYQTAQPRLRVPAQQQSTANRSSAYDVYDNYLSPGDNGTSTTSNRQSGIEGLGMGFMNVNMDDDSDSSDDEEDMRRTRMASSPKALSKNAALAAATGASPSKAVSPSKGAFAPERLETPPPQYSSPQQRKQSPAPTQSPQIAAPRPGYAAPIAALNQMSAVARPQPSAVPSGRNNNPNGLRIVAPDRTNDTPSPTSSPHPLQAPVTPITPVFARPQRTATMDSTGSVAFSETKGLIMRGDREETLLARGEKGEQFWRRFSMVAKDPQEKGPSPWLKKNQGGASRHKRWIWIVGLILVICAAAGIGLGVYLSEQASAHYRPDAIGGSANEGTQGLLSTTSAHASGKSSVKGALATSTQLHVSPTNTVARRETVPQFTAAPGHARRNQRMARLEPEEAL
ncbi:hypothetical protein C8F01DRAFT_518255 [Mycena amicta]|nr:hypothetical protein C8F01DRAFT_518255 [Mycena amicta]